MNKKIKYAIYKGNIGLYDWEYCDTEESIKGYPYIKSSSLPVIINDKGGYTSFSKEESDFIKIIEVNEDEEPLTLEERYPKNSKDFKYGWIDLDGNTYNTGHQGHLKAAEKICNELKMKTFNGERHLENLGWIKTTKGMFDNESINLYVENGIITRKQYNTLFDIGLSEHELVKIFVRKSEERW